MQQIRTTLSPFTLRSRSVRISRRALELTDGLDLGEQVLVIDEAAGVRFTATVEDIDVEGRDTTYRIELRVALSAEEAESWALPTIDYPAGQLSAYEVMDILAAVRRSRELVSSDSIGFLADAPQASVRTL